MRASCREKQCLGVVFRIFGEKEVSVNNPNKAAYTVLHLTWHFQGASPLRPPTGGQPHIKDTKIKMLKTPNTQKLK